MRLIELSGPHDAADTHAAWAQRLKLFRRGLSTLGLAVRPARRQRVQVSELEFHAEACAPEGAQFGALYVNGRLHAKLDGVSRF
jgi:hypothetical protein